MAEIRRQTVYNDGGPQALEIVGVDGRSILLTKQDIQTFYQSTSGSAASRRAQVIAWIKQSIVDALGPETITVEELDYDFDLNSGGISTARIGVISP